MMISCIVSRVSGSKKTQEVQKLSIVPDSPEQSRNRSSTSPRVPGKVDFVPECFVNSD